MNPRVPLETRGAAAGDWAAEQASSGPARHTSVCEKAKATAGEFVKAFHAQKPSTKDFYVKKPYPTPSGSQEHMWIEVNSEDAGVIHGVVSNEAEETREVKIGQQVSLRLTEISDWKYQEGNKLIGGYTIRYFVDKMAPKEREEFLKQAGFEL